MTTCSLTLTLFFSRGVSLQMWEHAGMFEREVAIYRRLQARGVSVRFVTYGDEHDRAYAERLPGITILCNRWRLPPHRYTALIPLLHAPALQRSAVLKTNQTNGAAVALRTARYWRKPLIARCGYMWSEHATRHEGEDAPETRLARSTEHRVFSIAQRVVVTTPAMAVDIAQRVPSAAARTVVIPNYVDTTTFCPALGEKPRWDIIFIGRLVPQKNISALLEALAPLDVRCLIIGEGALREPLQQRFGTLHGRLQWQGNVPNQTLPTYLNQARVYILPSHYEGHPKTLIEAMACGLPVIGTDAPGIREVIRHRETGYLCSTSVEHIRAALQEVLGDANLRDRMGRNARHYVLDHFALDRIGALELALLQEVAQQWQHSSPV